MPSVATFTFVTSGSTCDVYARLTIIIFFFTNNTNLCGPSEETIATKCYIGLMQTCSCDESVVQAEEAERNKKNRRKFQGCDILNSLRWLDRVKKEYVQSTQWRGKCYGSPVNTWCECGREWREWK